MTLSKIENAVYDDVVRQVVVKSIHEPFHWHATEGQQLPSVAASDQVRRPRSVERVRNLLAIGFASREPSEPASALAT